MAACILGTEHLTKKFGSFTALDNVDLEVGEGATGLLGPNGAGKTTLLRVLLGLLPAQGRAEVLGLDPTREPLQVRARLGYMPESECLIPGLTSVEVVAFLGRLAGLERRQALKRAHEVLYYVGLGEARYRAVDEYSLGMQQRLKLAQALVHDPDVLFLDEPTNGLDPKGRTEMLGLISELAREHHKHIILSSHLLPDVEAVCPHVVVLDRGRVVRQGDVAEMTAGGDRAWHVEIRGDADGFCRALTELGATAHMDGAVLVELPGGGDDTSLIFRAAVDTGVQVRGLTPTRRSLEDVFLDAVAD